METIAEGNFRTVDSPARVESHRAVGWTFLGETSRGSSRFLLKWECGGEQILPPSETPVKQRILFAF
jgi:hypothetical protein